MPELVSIVAVEVPGCFAKYVTEIDNKTNTWKAESGKPPVIIPEKVAKSLVLCLLQNGVSSSVITAPKENIEKLCNP